MGSIEGDKITMTRIYTRTGDDGQTSMGDGNRVRKDTLPLEVCGTLDELNSLLGVAISDGVVSPVHRSLVVIQSDLFGIGAEIAYPKSRNVFASHFSPDRIRAMEKEMDDLTESLLPLKNFILPGGSRSAAMLHLARAVCRRAERLLVRLASDRDINPSLLIYMNRVSDLLFVMARYENMRKETAETIWKPLP